MTDRSTRSTREILGEASMWGMRNRIAHGYLLIDADIVRSTLERDVPGIIIRIQTALDEMP